MRKPVKITLIVSGILLLGVIGYFAWKWFFTGTDEHLKAIPSNAAAVLKINTQDLGVKADPLKLLQEPAFRDIKGPVKNLLSDPFSTGIDPIENVYAFVAKDGQDVVSALVFSVDDAEELSTFVEGLNICSSIEEKDGIWYGEIDGRRGIAWNEKMGMAISVSDNEAKFIAEDYLNQPESKSIKSNEAYKEFAGKTFDIGLYIDNKAMTAMSGKSMPMSLMGMTDGHAELLVRFENDKITADYTNYSLTPSSVVLKKSGPAADHFDAIAPQAPLVYLGLAADVNKLFELLNSDEQMREGLQQIETNLGMREEPLKKLLTGDVSIAFTDYKDISTYDPRISAKISQLVTMAGGDDYIDRSEFSLYAPMAYITLGHTNDKRMEELLSTSGLMKNEGFYYMPTFDFIVYAASKDGQLLITNDYYAAQSFSQAGKLAGKLPAGVPQNSPLLLWMDLDQKHFPAALTDPAGAGYLGDEAMLMLSWMDPVKSVRVESPGAGSHVEVLLEPGEGNSLYRLISHAGTHFGK